MVSFADLCQLVQQTEPFANGLAVTDVLTLPAPFDQMVQTLLRRRKLTAVALLQPLQLTNEEATRLAQQMQQQGWIRPVDEVSAEPVYRVNLAQKRVVQLPQSIWQAFDE